MASPKMTLRPPPNVDFISGYPGLAPGPPDRPHAAVKGTLEFRTNQPLKAKWLHVELRKVESVPGVPPFMDIVGAKPTIVWQPHEREGEFGTLQSVSLGQIIRGIIRTAFRDSGAGSAINAALSLRVNKSRQGQAALLERIADGSIQQDFSFAIRIPESVPPTIMLDNGRAGIRYELIATLCAKGKKGLLRRDSPALTTTSCEIVILKHEMHATWPVYAQPEERSVTMEGLQLTVQRRRTCLGAGGDSLAMQATVHAEGLVPLAGFELSLVQKIAYPNTGAAPGGKKAVTLPPRSITISEQKIPLNARIQPGMHQSCELLCMLPPDYHAMTVATARLIENTYMVIVSAILEGNRAVKITLPITISPFPIPYSADMMQRMGQPPMALDHPSRAQFHQQQLAAASRPASTNPSLAAQMGPGAQGLHPPPIQQRPYNITERIGGQAAAAAAAAAVSPTDNSLLGGELGSPYGQPVQSATMPNGSNWQSIGTNRPGTGGANGATYPANAAGHGYGEFGQPMGQAPSAQSISPPGSPPAAPPTVATATARFTVVNTNENELDSPRSSRIHDAPFMTAADEKRLLAMQVNDPQSYAAVPPPGPPPASTPTAGSNAGGSGSSSTANPATSQAPRKKNWLSAEQEKQKLYEKARAAAETTQRKAANTNIGSVSKASSPKGSQFAETQLSSSSPGPAILAEEIKPAVASPKPSTQKEKKWISAEDEKRKLYEKAQLKAARTQAKAAIAATGATGVIRADSAKSKNGGPSESIVSPYGFTSSSPQLKGADLYQSAMSAIKSTTGTGPSTASSPSTAPPKSNSPPVTTPVQVQPSPPPPAASPVNIPPPFTPPPITPPANVHQFASDTPPPAGPPPPHVMRSNSGWLSAEDEKARLRYLDAKRAVERHTAFQDDEYGAGSSSHDHGGPSGYADYSGSQSAGGYYSGVASGSGYTSPPPITSPRNDASGYMSPPPGNPPSWNMISPAPPPVVVDPPQQPASYSPPPMIGQQALYQSAITPPPLNLSSTPTPPPPSSDPPPFSPSLGYTHATDIPEKEKMRLAYAQQDYATSSSSKGDLPPPDYGGPPPGNPSTINGYGSPPPMDDGMYPSQPLTAAEEKARLKAQWATDDAVGSAGGSGSSGAGGSSDIYSRPPPEPPFYAGGTRTLTAAEEKARLQAQVAAERPISSVPPAPPPRVKSPPLTATLNTPISAISERPPPSSYLSTSSISSDNDYLRRDPSISQGKQRVQLTGNGIIQSPIASSSPMVNAAPPIPPPLAPRPPKEYIEKTKEEDLKIRRMTGDTAHFHSFTLDDNPPWLGTGSFLGNNDFSLGLRPFSPIDLSLDDMLRNGNAGPQPANGANRTSLYR